MKLGYLDAYEGCDPVIIAEAGLCHNGSIERARMMIGAAADAGCDIVKFQTFRAHEFCQPSDPLFETFKASELPEDAWPILKKEADDCGILFMSTPQNRTDLDILLKVGVPAIKVGSDDFTNLALLQDYAKAGLPMILSCGMSYMHEVAEALEATKAVERALLVCTSEYPCAPAHANLRRVLSLRIACGPMPIGLSDHTRGSQAAAMALAMGACIFEKHFTMDHRLPGPDHWFACEPAELTQYVSDVYDAYRMMGDGEVKPTAVELRNKPKWQRKSGQQLRGLAA